MNSNSTGSSDVLHPAHHSSMSAEEVAKALARHKKHHPEDAKASVSKQNSNKK